MTNTLNAQRLLDNAGIAMASMSDLVAAYNSGAQTLNAAGANFRLVKRFSDRKTAERRVAEMMAAVLDAGPKQPTILEPALANGAEGQGSVHSRKSLEDRRAKAKPARKPRPEPEVKAVRARKANRAAKGAKLALKQNREVRALLTKAAQAAGASRLSPIGFASYTEFLAGVPLDANGNAEVVFVPVKGNAPVAGKNVKLTIVGGKVAKVK
jgi:hypothetical protein